MFQILVFIAIASVVFGAIKSAISKRTSSKSTTYYKEDFTKTNDYDSPNSDISDDIDEDDFDEEIDEDEPEEKFFCAYCGSELDANDKKCPYCGAKKKIKKDAD